MIDVGFFDFGGVIAEEGFVGGLRAIGLEQGKDPGAVLQAGVDAAWETEFVLGRADEAAFWDFVRARTGIVGEDADLRRRLYDHFIIRPWMLEVVDRVRAAGVRPAILSDQAWWLDKMDEMHGFFRHFDKVFNSFHCGLSKRDEAFFKLALDEMGTEAGRTFFVDDNEGNVERADKLGMNAILYVDRPAFERELHALVPAAAGK